jgi:L-2-hydroxyglutarate oxidase LhgO
MEQLEQIGIIARKIIPDLRIEKTCAVFSGSRSICIETDDFWIAASSKDQRFINVAGISSPGLSAAPAIAQEVIALVKAQTALMPKPKYTRHRGRAKLPLSRNQGRPPPLQHRDPYVKTARQVNQENSSEHDYDDARRPKSNENAAQNCQSAGNLC